MLDLHRHDCFMGRCLRPVRAQARSCLSLASRNESPLAFGEIKFSLLGRTRSGTSDYLDEAIAFFGRHQHPFQMLGECAQSWTGTSILSGKALGSCSARGRTPLLSTICLAADNWEEADSSQRKQTCLVQTQCSTTWTYSPIAIRTTQV